MCHKLWTAIRRTSVDLLSGNVDVDVTFIGGVKQGVKRRRGAPGKAPAIADPFENKPFNIKRSGPHTHEVLRGSIGWPACSSAWSEPIGIGARLSLAWLRMVQRRSNVRLELP